MAEINDSTHKRCETCKIEFLLEQFSKNKSTKDGFSKSCKSCRKVYGRDYYAKNKERFRENNRQNYLKNSDAYKARARKWEAENIERKRELRADYRTRYRDKIKESSRADWAKHNEKRRAAKKAYRQANPERGAEHVRARQARRQRAMPIWADRDAIRAIYLECRRISQETGVEHHVDHFYPLKNSLVCGLHNEYNLRILPATENQSKGNSFPMENEMTNKVKAVALRDFAHGNIEAKEGKLYEINQGDAIELEKAGFLTIDADSRRKPADTQVDEIHQPHQPGDVVTDSKAAPELENKMASATDNKTKAKK